MGVWRVVMFAGPMNVKAGVGLSIRSINRWEGMVSPGRHVTALATFSFAGSFVRTFIMESMGVTPAMGSRTNRQAEESAPTSFPST